MFGYILSPLSPREREKLSLSRMRKGTISREVFSFFNQPLSLTPSTPGERKIINVKNLFPYSLIPLFPCSFSSVKNQKKTGFTSCLFKLYHFIVQLYICQFCVEIIFLFKTMSKIEQSSFFKLRSKNL